MENNELELLEDLTNDELRVICNKNQISTKGGKLDMYYRLKKAKVVIEKPKKPGRPSK